MGKSFYEIVEEECIISFSVFVDRIEIFTDKNRVISATSYDWDESKEFLPALTYAILGGKKITHIWTYDTYGPELYICFGKDRYDDNRIYIPSYANDCMTVDIKNL